MPTITYDKADLLKLIGGNVTEKALIKALEDMKPGIEEIKIGRAHV